MNPNSEQAKSIFLRALECESSDVAHFLSVECEGNADLRREVDVLLQGHRQGADLADRALVACQNVISENDSSAVSMNPGARIGPYTIREQIGEGGMGVVYVAEQTEPVQRKVALKIIKPGMDTKEVIARFEAERQALAFMEHPNIARVLDAGTTDGRPYFVMELVRGIPITEYCDQMKATPRERLELFQTVCDAVQHAHQKGIIHRDIKPSNVLVTQVGAKPVVKVIDFGLAKAISGQRLTDKTLYTGFMKLMGTPAYMSPEQAGLSGLDIDTRSDIYSLGVLLYELLTGTTPIDKTAIQKQAYDELCRQIRETDAPKPSTRFSTLQDAQRSTVAELRQIEPNRLRQLLHGDLDRVVLKAIEKDRDRRYASPQDLAADVERFLDDKPVLAVPPSPFYLAQKTFRRHKVAIASVTIIMTFLVLATAFSSWQAILAAKANERAVSKAEAASLSERVAQDAKLRALDEAKRAEEQKRQADKAKQEAIASRNVAQQTSEERRRLLYVSNMQSADHLWHSQSGTPYQIQKLLADWIPTSEEPNDDLRDLAWRFQWTRLHHNAETTVSGTLDATLSPRGNLLIANEEGIKEWDEAKGTFDHRWPQPLAATPHKHVSLSPCGRWAAVLVEDSIRFIDISECKVVLEVPGTDATFGCGGDHAIVRRLDSNSRWADYQVWNLATGECISRDPIEQPKTYSLAMSSDGRSFFIGRPPGYLTFYRDEAKQPWEEKNYLQVFSSDWAPNGKLIASGHFSGRIRIHIVDDLGKRVEINTERDWIRALRFTDDSRKLVVGGNEGTVDFYDLSPIYDSLNNTVPVTKSQASGSSSESLPKMAQPLLVRTIKAHVSKIESISLSGDSSKMVTRDADGTAKLWELDKRRGFLPQVDVSDLPLAGRVGLEFDADETGVHIANVVPMEHQLIDGEIRAGDRILSIVDDAGRLEIDSLAGDYQAQRNLVWFSLSGPADSVVTLKLLARGVTEPHTVRLRRKVHARAPNYHDIAFTNNGILVGSESGAASRAIDGTVQKLYATMCKALDVRTDSPLAAMSATGNIEFWNLQKKQRRDSLATGASHITARFSPNGKYFAASTGSPRLNTSPRRSELSVWETETLRAAAVPLVTDEVAISGIEFTPNGEKLLATDHGGKVRIWSTSNWEMESTLKGLSRAFTIDVSVDSRWIAQGGRNGIVIWDLPTLKIRHVLPEYNVTKVLFSHDNRTLMATGQGGAVVWLDVNTGMQLASMPLESGLLMDCELTSDESSLAVLSLNGNIWLHELETLSRIDQHRFTFSALRRRALEQLAAQQPEAAEQTLEHLLRLQLNLPQQKRMNVRATRTDLLRAFASQGKLPSIATQPCSQSVEKGSAVTLHVELASSGAENVRYQWFFEGKTLEDETEATLELSSLTEDQFGRYSVQCGFGPADLELFLMSDIATIRDAAKTAVFETGLKKELFSDVPGGNVDDLRLWPHYPHGPDEVSTIDTFELPSNSADNYGVRVSGFVVPPRTGNYVFYLCSDDTSELYLSTNETETDQVLIARVRRWQPQRKWQEFNSENISHPIYLQGGKRYRVKALFKEGTVGDHFAVTWQMPDEPPPKNDDPPIPGEFLQFPLE